MSGLSFCVARFATAMPDGPAFGTMERLSWPQFTKILAHRRVGEKDGPSLVFACFKPDPDGRVRRLKANVVSRTAIALDIETSKETGEIAPPMAEAEQRIKARGWCAAIYSSHNHTAGAPRYRIILPLTEEIAPNFPAPEAAAEALGLAGVLDTSKIGAASLFYLPSAEKGRLADHATIIVDGAPIHAEWMREHAGALLAAREAEQARQRAEAMAAAEARRAARSARGQKDDENLISAIRDRLDLESELLRHGYEKKGKSLFLFPHSKTGNPGVHLMTGNDGVQRVYSHHSGDPLAAGNLPSWCTVKATDAVDLVAILDFAGDRKKALHTLATRFGIGARPMQENSEPPDAIPQDGELPPGDGAKPADERENAAGGQQQTGLKKWTVLNPVFWLHKPVTEREWIVQDWLPLGCVTANYGDGGLGKTLLAQQLQTACATGKPWCGLAVEPCRSIGLYCEDDADELHRRQAKMCEAMRLSLSDLADMRVISGVGHDNVLCEPDSNGGVRFTSRLADLIEEAERIEARLIVLDVAADLFGANENDRAAVRRFIGRLNAVAHDLRCAVLLNAHPSRDGLKTGKIDGGSTAWNNSVRSRWSLERPPGEDVTDNTPERILSRRKANYSSVGEAIRLVWRRGVLEPVQAASGLAGMAERQGAEAVFLDLLARTMAAEQRVSDSTHASNYAPKVFAKRPDAQGYRAKDMEGAMARLFAAGKIKMQEYGRKGDARQQIILAAVQTHT